MIKPSLKSGPFGKPNPLPKKMVVGVGLPRSRIHTLTPGPIYLSEPWLTCVWFVWLRKKKQLVGGWTNPFEKYLRQNGFIFLQFSRWTIKKILETNHHVPKQVECWCQLGWEKNQLTWQGSAPIGSINSVENTCWTVWNQGFQGLNLHFGAPKKNTWGILPVFGEFFSPQTTRQVKCHQHVRGATFPAVCWLRWLRPVAATVDLLAAKILGFLESWTPNFCPGFLERFKWTKTVVTQWGCSICQPCWPTNQGSKFKQ